MNHSHHHHHHTHGNEAGKNIAIAFMLNAFFVVVEVIGGIFTNSIAILTDALHDFGDCLSLGTAWFLQKKSEKKSDLKYSYGYKRFSLLSGIFLSGIITVSSIFVLVEAVRRIFNPQVVYADGMLWVAVFGIIINGAAALRVKKGNSINERAVYLHIVEDVLGWIGVLIVSIVMKYVYVPILDSILSIVITIWVLVNAAMNLKSAFAILLQMVPQTVSVKDLQHEIISIEDVISIHDLHIWSLDGESHVMTLHVVSDTNDTEALKRGIAMIAEKYNISHTTIEIEKNGEICFRRCD